MLWMGIWVHPYTVIPVQMGANFWKIGVWLSLSDVVVSWLRLQTPADCFPHPYWMYTKCFSTVTCCGWAYGCTLTLLSCAGGGQILENWGMIESEWCCGVMIEAANPHWLHPTSIQGSMLLTQKYSIRYPIQRQSPRGAIQTIQSSDRARGTLG